MKLFSNNIVPYASTEGDKIYPIVVDIKKGIKSGEAISFVTADNQVGVITVDFMDGNSSYSIEGCMVTSTIHRPDGTVLEIPCDIISQSTIEIPLGINGTYQEGTHTFDLKIVRGNGKVIGVPTMSYSVSGSLSSDDVVEGDDRLPVLTMVLDNAQDKLTRLDKAIAGVTNDLEVKEARDGEVTLNARLERDLAKGKIHFVDVEGSYISTESQEGYLENIEIHGNTWQDSENLADIRSVGAKVEGQELYKIPVLSVGKNLLQFNPEDLIYDKFINDAGEFQPVSGRVILDKFISINSNKSYVFSSNKVNIDWTSYYDANKNFIKRIPGSTIANIPANARYMKFTLMRNGATLEDLMLVQYQLEEGTQATPYEPYQEDKLTILSPTPLEKVGDIADRIICKNGVWGVEKNIETKVLNGSEGWFMSTWVTSTTRTFEYLDMTINFKLNEVQVLSDKFVGMSRSSVSDITDTEYIATSGGLKIFINILKSKLPTENVAGLKSWLKTNPMLIKYQSTQPQFIPLPHDQQIKLRTFADRTHIHFETEIEGTIKAQVPKSLGATVNTHTSQIDNLNKELDRVKKLEESTVSTVEAESNFTTVTETSNGYFEDVKLEGKTLVNLSSQVNTTINQFSIVASSRYMLKNSTTYTVIITNKEQHPIRLYGNEQTFVSIPTFEVGSRSTIVKKVHTLDEVKSLGLFKSNSSTGTIFNLDLVLLEGDHTDKDITFFEGLKSVGQSSSGESEEISVLSDNNFVSNEKYLTTDCTYYSASMSTTSLAQTIIYKSGKHISNLAYVVPCERNTEYTVSTSNRDSHSMFMICELHEDPSNGIKYYNYSENVVANQTESSYTIKTTDKAKYVMVFIGEKYNEQFNISLYTKQDKKQILYYNPNTQTWEKPVLREWDSVEKHSDGKYYYHKRSGEVMLDGSSDEPISMRNDSTTNTVGFTIDMGDEAGSSGAVICNKFPHKLLDITDDSNEFTRIITPGSNPCLYFKINKSKLSTQDVAGFKKWLQANPTTVVYQLAQEEVYECTNLDLITYGGETNLIVNSGVIQPRITLKVLSNVSNVVKLLQEKVSILENKFIEGLKQVLSGDMLSLAHLLYPEDFENNHEIQTLEL